MPIRTPLRLPGWGAVAHVFVAVALALPFALAAASIGLAAALPDQSLLNRWLLVLLGIGFLAAVTWAALLPPVRQVEVGTARVLLGVELPDVAVPAAARSRLAGASWLGLLVVLGAVVGLAVLYLLPTGVGLLAHPLSGAEEVRWPNSTATWETGTGWSAAWVVLPGLGSLLAMAAVVVVAARLLVRWAPGVLGPTAADRLALAQARERDLARANALARDVHDTIGHTLTAMTVQATAARRLLPTDPARAAQAMAAVEELGRRAQADVDAVVGALRDGRSAGPLAPVGGSDAVHRLRSFVDDLPVPVRADLPTTLDVPVDVAAVVEAAVREGLTNAVRHGRPPVTLQVLRAGDRVRVEVRNAVPAIGAETPAGRPGGGVGLAGLRERVLLADGSVVAGREDGDGADGSGRWMLVAEVPVAGGGA